MTKLPQWLMAYAVSLKEVEPNQQPEPIVVWLLCVYLTMRIVALLAASTLSVIALLIQYTSWLDQIPQPFQDTILIYATTLFWMILGFFFYRGIKAVVKWCWRRYIVEMR